MRNIGKTKQQIENMTRQLIKGKSVLVAGLKNTRAYLEILREKGIKARAEETFITSYTEQIDEVTGIIHSINSKKISTGFKFEV